MDKEFTDKLAFVKASYDRTKKTVEERKKTLQTKFDAILNVEKTSRYPAIALSEYKKLFHDAREIYTEIIALQEELSILTLDLAKFAESKISDSDSEVESLKSSILVASTELELLKVQDDNTKSELRDLAAIGVIDKDVIDYYFGIENDSDIAVESKNEKIADNSKAVKEKIVTNKVDVDLPPEDLEELMNMSDEDFAKAMGDG